MGWPCQAPICPLLPVSPGHVGWCRGHAESPHLDASGPHKNRSGGCPCLGEPGPGHLHSPACSPPGLGLALNFQPSPIMLNRYFNKRRPMANGLAAAGSPVFQCALSPLGQVLQDHYGWRGGFLILGGLLLNCCVCAALMRPLEAPRQSSGSGPAPQRPPRRLLDLSVFRDRGFVIYALAASIMVLGSER